MCEPCHSIVQYPNDDNDDTSSGTPLEQRVSKLGEWLRKIGRWLHLSKMGKGHSEAIHRMSFQTELFLPSPTMYEVDWWERRLRFDGGFRGQFSNIGRNQLELSQNFVGNQRWAVLQALKEEAKEAAQQYANAVSIGNMTTFRRFLTTSITKSPVPMKYVLHFELMLTKEGRDILHKKLKSFACISKTNVESVAKMLMWFTRKRELLVPEWADDQRLWVPSKLY